MKLRKSRGARRGRIEIIPMIDVMFFLLATFMLASLSMQRLNSLPVNLPEGQAQPLSSGTPLTLTITKGSKIYLNHEHVTLKSLSHALKPLLRSKMQNVVVSADRDAPQGIVVEAMLAARSAGAQHFLIAVRNE